MIALRGVWQLCLAASETVVPGLRGLPRGERLFVLGCCFIAAAVLGITAVASDSWLVAGTKHNLLDSGWGLRCCRAIEIGWRIES